MFCRIFRHHLQIQRWGFSYKLSAVSVQKWGNTPLYRGFMFNLRSISLFLVIAGLFASIALRVNATPETTHTAQTIITRTPTSSPPTAAPPNPTSPPAPPQATATAINTAVPTTTPTITPTATRIPAIFLGVTAEPCGRPPTIWTISTANLRAGPGTDYAIIGNLIYNESRAILGRAEDAEWWLLPLTENETAWVANSAVTVQGDISDLPIVPVPPLNGATVTPAATTWNPTPNPICPTAVPATETATITPSATASATVDVTAMAIATTTAAAESVAAVSTATAQPTTGSSASTPTLTATAIIAANTPIAPATVVNDAAQPTAVPLDGEDEGEEKTAVSNFLLIGGGLLLLGGVALLLFKRQGGE